MPPRDPFPTVSYRAVGVVRSPFTRLEGMPLQSVAGGAVRARVEVRDELVAGLRDLDGFSHLHLITHLHRGKPGGLEVMPFLDDRVRGIFATRSPRHPNPIGISVVRLEAVRGAVLEITGVDLVDGTPVLDIKPYVPAFDSFAAERTGWLERAAGRVHHTRADGRFDDDARRRWNHRYAERGLHPFPDAPAAWLVEHRELVTSARGGRALDVACGDGRNSAYLARLGLEVDAVDISDVAIDALAAAVAARRLPVTPIRLDLECDPLPDGPYDVIVQINYLQRTLAAGLAERLRPGGLLLVETVTRAHVEELGNRFDPRFLLEPGELRDAFAGLEVLRYEERVAERSGRARAVASLVARRT